MSTREDIAQAIVDFEARRDGTGRLMVYALPHGDGGGRYEVAGINDRYHPHKAFELAQLIHTGHHAKAEERAADYIAKYTDPVAAWHPNPGIQAFLRDSYFNRGPKGAALILQLAVGAKPDGVVGPKTRAAAEQASAGGAYRLLLALRGARERYERTYVGYRPQFWAGLVARWNKAVTLAERYLEVANDVEPAGDPGTDDRGRSGDRDGDAPRRNLDRGGVLGADVLRGPGSEEPGGHETGGTSERDENAVTPEELDEELREMAEMLIANLDRKPGRGYQGRIRVRRVISVIEVECLDDNEVRYVEPSEISDDHPDIFVRDFVKLGESRGGNTGISVGALLRRILPLIGGG